MSTLSSRIEESFIKKKKKRVYWEDTKEGDFKSATKAYRLIAFIG